MGFLKRIFSIGSKKSKKRPHIVHNVGVGLRTIEEEEHEAAVGRLLRSSSARFAVVSELDYASLPPLPHPINEVLQTPATSTVSIASTSMSQRGTYNVTVHGRKQHTAPEYVCLTPERCISRPERIGENSQLLGLRSDPSVISLLDMYDDHGRISPTAFSNSPPSPKRERAQTRRNGSTLRQLLGNPSSAGSQNDPSVLEGDISWAERFLGETESASSTSSLGFYTPTTPDTPFADNDLHPHNVHHDTTIFSDYNLSINTVENQAISSMEVELSIGPESIVSFDENSKCDRPRASSDSITPRRASQVFKFLTDKRRALAAEAKETPLPELPSAFSFSSNESSSFPEAHSHFSEDSFESSHHAAPALPSRSDKVSVTSLNHTEELSHMPYAPPLQTSTYDPIQGKIENEVEVIMIAPTRVIVTAPTPSTARNKTSYRAPRGPRTHSRKTVSGGSKRQRTILADCDPLGSSSFASGDPFTPVPSRRKPHHRSASQNSFVSISLPTDQPFLEKTTNTTKTRSRSILTELDKENLMGLSAMPQIPPTPLRGTPKSKSSPRDSRSLYRVAVTPGMFRPPGGMTPSPASSSELSPVGRRLMMNLRRQRTKAREAEREKGGRSARMSVRR